MAKRILELLKDFLIFILSVAIVVLTLMALPTKTLTDSPVLAAALRPVAHYFGISQVELALRQDTQSTAAASQPLAVSVRNGGGRSTYQYSFSALDPVYETMGGTLAQALGTCEKPETSDRETLYAALSDTSVCFCYGGTLDCAILAGWLGTETEAGGTAAQLYALSAEENAVYLYFVSDTVLRAKTQIETDALRELCGSAPADGSFFAFENDDAAYAAIDGLSLLPASAPVLSGMTAQTTFEGRALTVLASDLGFNPYAGTSYEDADGTRHYSENNASLVISADGLLSLENSDPSRLGDYPTDAAGRISAAAALLKSMPGSDDAAVRLYLTDYTPTAAGARLTFSFVADGVPILTQTPISVEFTGRYISAIRTVLRAYTVGSAPVCVLPPLQAAAISEPGSILHVCYADTKYSALTAGWAR